MLPKRLQTKKGLAQCQPFYFTYILIKKLGPLAE
ncbi:hypothetical protein VCHENC02_1215, partial [Vibrio harveyi]